MAKRPPPSGGGSWLVLEELLDRGDPAFVDELRRLSDADRLGAFAAKWYGDKRAASRRLLLDYLNQPLNAYRHEALVKRLFKLAEQAGDDEVMARFLVLFDRAVRRKRRQRYRWFSATRQSWQEEWVRVPAGTTMPRPQQTRGRNPRTGGRLPAPPPHDRFRLFSVHTRNYLRRRTWRYLRRLGKKQPERYLPAVTAALKLYEDADVADGLALIDNWGLIHILFHHCPALVARPHGWTLADGHTLAELAPAPIYEPLWRAAPQRLIELLKEARCRPVRRWVIRLLQRDHGAALAGLPLVELLGLLGHADPEVVALAAEALRGAAGLDTVGVDRWLALLETPNAEALPVLCELMAAHVRPERVSFEQAVKLAASRPLPVARLGLSFLRAKQPESPADCQALLGLAEAEAELLRAELVRWARGVLSASPHFQPVWVMEYLDSRHADVRAEGWAWLQADERAHDNVELWRRILESPHDDVRLRLVADLEARVARQDRALSAEAALDPELVRFLWASVLLNIHRGNRAKPVVVRQMVRRLERRPHEAPLLLPILSVALRSVRGPEFRAGLAGVVQIAERSAELRAAVREAFPELKLV
jgi:hypothetical protein